MRDRGGGEGCAVAETESHDAERGGGGGVRRVRRAHGTGKEGREGVHDVWWIPTSIVLHVLESDAIGLANEG